MASSGNAGTSTEPNSLEVRRAEIKKALNASLKEDLEMICSELKIIGIAKLRKSRIIEVLAEHIQKNKHALHVARLFRYSL